MCLKHHSFSLVCSKDALWDRLFFLIMNFKMKILTGLHFSPGRSLICKNLTWRITPQHTSLQLPLLAWSPTQGCQCKRRDIPRAWLSSRELRLWAENGELTRPERRRPKWEKEGAWAAGVKVCVWGGGRDKGQEPVRVLPAQQSGSATHQQTGADIHHLKGHNWYKQEN